MFVDFALKIRKFLFIGYVEESSPEMNESQASDRELQNLKP